MTDTEALPARSVVPAQPTEHLLAAMTRAVKVFSRDADPNELVNVAEDPANAEQVAEFVTLVQNFQLATNDPWFHKWIYE